MGTEVITPLTLKQIKGIYFTAGSINIRSYQNKVLVIKTYPLENLPNVENMLHVVTKLNLNYESIPKYQRLIYGKYLYHDSEKILTAYEYIDGKDCHQSNVNDDFILGYNLGKLHLELSRINPTIQDFPIKIKTHNIETFKELLGSSENSALISYKLKLIEKENLITPSDVCRLQLIHGDLRLSNIIFKDGQVFFVDFDQLSNFYKSYDLIRFSFLNYWDSISTKFNTQKMKLFWNGYFATNEIEVLEKTKMIRLFYQTQLLDDYGLFDQKKTNSAFFLYKQSLLRFLSREIKQIERVFNHI
jgi:Ser/Thr protein kinase RdoA (MazF antagonist)